MILLDWVPTAGEVFGWFSCRLSDHDWVEQNGKIVCSDCGKEQAR